MIMLNLIHNFSSTTNKKAMLKNAIKTGGSKEETA